MGIDSKLFDKEGLTMKSSNKITVFIIIIMAAFLFTSCGDGETQNSASSSSNGAVDNGSLQHGNQLSPPKRDMLNTLKTKMAGDHFVRYTYDTSYQFDFYQINTIVEEDDCLFNLLTCTSFTNNRHTTGYEYQSETQSSIDHLYGSSRTEAINQLIQILNAAVDVKSFGYNYYGILQANGESYYFDLSLPLGANPVGYYDYPNNEGYILKQVNGYDI